MLALGQAARHGQDQGHGHVGRVLGQDARRVGHADAALARGLEIDVVDTRAEGGDQAEVRAGLGQHAGIDPVGHGRDQDVGLLDRLDQLGLAHRPILDVQARPEELHHAGLDNVREPARDDHQGFVLRHLSVPTLEESGPAIAVADRPCPAPDGGEAWAAGRAPAVPRSGGFPGPRATRTDPGGRRLTATLAPATTGGRGRLKRHTGAPDGRSGTTSDGWKDEVHGPA